MLTLNRIELKEARDEIEKVSHALTELIKAQPSPRSVTGLKLKQDVINETITLNRIAFHLEEILDRESPQSIVTEYDGYADGNPALVYYCPNCETELGEPGDPCLPYCPYCGQAIDWSFTPELEETNDANS